MTDHAFTRFDDDLVRRLFERRILLLGTALDETSGTRLMSGMLLLSNDDPHSDIQLWIHSPGGSVHAMLAIRDVMRAVPNTVATVALGMAASAGQFLLSAGTPGHRFALPHARVLLHQGSAGIGGVAQDIAIQADDLRHSRDTVLAAVAADTGQPAERIERDSRRDRWFSADEARDYGFIDHIVTSVEDIRPTRHRTVGLGGTT